MFTTLMPDGRPTPRGQTYRRRGGHEQQPQRSAHQQPPWPRPCAHASIRPIPTDDQVVWPPLIHGSGLVWQAVFAEDVEVDVAVRAKRAAGEGSLPLDTLEPTGAIHKPERAGLLASGVASAVEASNLG